MTERVEGATLAEQTVQLDGRRFVSCTFDACRIVYAGGPTDVLDCVFTDCVWHLDGDAANTVALLGALGASDGPTGPRLVAGLLSRLRRTSEDATAIQTDASTPERVGVGATDDLRIVDVTIRTSTEDTDRGAAPAAGPTPGDLPRQRSRAGRWLFASGDVAWIVIAAGVVLATVILGRTGG